MLLLWWYWSEKTKHSGFSWGREITGQTSGRFLICSPNIHFSSFISDFSRWKIVGFFRNFFTHLQEALLCALLSPSRAWKMKLRKFVIVSLLTALANRKAINPRYRSNRLSFFVQELFVSLTFFNGNCGCDLSKLYTLGSTRQYQKLLCSAPELP